MRRYIITMLFLALLVGSLFKAAEDTGVRLMKMFATLGIFLFGLVGTMALNRWQSGQSLREVELALKSLEPEAVITDWAFRRDGRPDYLVIAPAGLVAVCLDEVSQSLAPERASIRIAKGCERTRDAMRWLRDRLSSAGPELKQPLKELVRGIPVVPVLVLTRRKADGTDLEGVTVVNADGLAEHLRRLHDPVILDEPTRVRLTRLFRQTKENTF